MSTTSQINTREGKATVNANHDKLEREPRYLQRPIMWDLLATSSREN